MSMEHMQNNQSEKQETPILREWKFIENYSSVMSISSVNNAIMKIFLTVSLKKKHGEKFHVVVARDSAPIVLNAFKNCAASVKNVDVSFCDFSELHFIDKAIRHDTALVYGEFPSFNEFRSYDFTEMRRYLDGLGIYMAVGLVFSNFCAFYSESVKPDFLIQYSKGFFNFIDNLNLSDVMLMTGVNFNEFLSGYEDKKIDITPFKSGECINRKLFMDFSKAAAGTLKIYKALVSLKDKFPALVFSYPSDYEYNDYKVKRKHLKFNGNIIRVSGPEKNICELEEIIKQAANGELKSSSGLNLRVKKTSDCEELFKFDFISGSFFINCGINEEGIAAALIGAGIDECEAIVEVLKQKR